MLEYDLSATILARSDQPPRIPTEGEMLALLVGLMLAEECTIEELHRRQLMLTEDNLDEVARLIEQYVLPWARELGAGTELRIRLGELTGLRVCNSGQRDGS